MEITIIPTTVLCLIIIILGNVEIIECEESERQVIPMENVLLYENAKNNETTPSRVKRQFGFFPYDPYYRPRPLPIIVGVGGFGIGGFRPGFGRGFGGFGGFGFGGRGFGSRGFGGRGFGGRGFGGGFGGFGGRGRG